MLPLLQMLHLVSNDLHDVHDLEVTGYDTVIATFYLMHAQRIFMHATSFDRS
jgi:hypothetical protein